LRWPGNATDGRQGTIFFFPAPVGYFVHGVDGVFDRRVDMILTDFYNQMRLLEYLQDGSIYPAK
jgi:hypothetical protein